MIKIGCNYLSFKGAEIGVGDFIQTCHDLRLDCLDFHQRAFASQDTDYLLGIKRQCLDLGLPVGYLGVAGGFAGDDDFQQAKIEEAKSAVDMALVLGAPLTRVFGWKTFKTEGRDPMFAALARCLREVCDYGAQKGVVVALQNHDNRNLASTGPDVLRIFQDVDHANLSFIMDTGQWRGSPGASGDPDPAADIYGYMKQTLPTRVTCAARSTRSPVDGRRCSITSASPASFEGQTTTAASLSFTKDGNPLIGPN